MKTLPTLILLTLAGCASAQSTGIANSQIDYQGFRAIVIGSGEAREQGRLDEAAFVQAMAEDKVVLLDARSADAYRLRHVRGAINLPFTDFTAERLAAIIPDTSTRILIYCNNNFAGSQRAFPTKAPAASLNLATQASLRAYGYRNIEELGPFLDVATTRIPFDGEEVVAGR
ncbi:MAG: rhodanese-like domain-containing protein [Pseudomonadota bacterium]|nr:rhodanese-like domain-containing protein [Pseudomonadota bacterium]